jgi:hypothetical protein
VLAEQLSTRSAIVIGCIAGMAVIGLVYRRFSELRR